MLGVIASCIAVLAITLDGSAAARHRVQSKISRRSHTAQASSVSVGTVLMDRYEVVQRLSSPTHICMPLQKFFLGRKRKPNATGTVNDVPLAVNITNGQAEEKLADLCGSMVGDGTYGEVYRAFDKEINRSVVIKIVKEKKVKEEPEVIQELSDECRITKKLQEEPLDDTEGASRLLKCYFNAAKTKYHMIVLEDAGDHVYDYLKAVKARNKASNWVRLKSLLVREVFMQVLQGVNYMSRKHIWHRDLKPNNIAVQDLENGSIAAKIIDFGFADVQPGTLEKTDKVIGKQFGGYIYAPPEVRQYHIEKGNARKQNQRLSRETLRLLKQQVEQAVLASVEAFDLWSVGISFLQMVCGEGLDRNGDFRRVRNFILPSLFPALKPPRDGNYARHIDAVLTEHGCWESHTKDDVTLKILKATLNIDPAQRYFPF
eukprot:TRINITY_DN8830_c0_g2_i1.p1 TRINITY_DN8830_c0_g2~~TRINITY_DN8830_c0_g2_i1.p1  ORF type:complete len:430 (-),score=50.20 TRINITY_DN8830_c0_g2_i1:186-1475(-)